jgi:hypothetical protein
MIEFRKVINTHHFSRSRLVLHNSPVSLALNSQQNYAFLCHPWRSIRRGSLYKNEIIFKSTS